MSREAIARYLYGKKRGEPHSVTPQQVDIWWEESDLKDSFYYEADQMLSKLRELGYVQLDEDQSFPPMGHLGDVVKDKEWFTAGYGDAQDEMFSYGFRRVKEIE